MRMTGGEIVMERLIAQGVPYLIGIPGHGCLALIDAALLRRDSLKVIQVRQEQSAVHMADGYYRVSGEPLAVFTSIGPGALNCAIGLATAYVDSTAVLVLSGETHTYMSGRGVLQEIERRRPADLPAALAPLVKKAYRPKSPVELDAALEDAFRQMQSGRPGPAFISLPMDVQADDAEVEPGRPVRNPGAAAPDAEAVAAAARVLLEAERPVILAGGGVARARAEPDLLALAEFLGAPVVTTVQAMDCFPADHPLCGRLGGTKGTSMGNALTSGADAVLAVGCRFADETTSSYRAGVTYSIPPTRLVHMDIDPGEIGKNYPVEAGVVADAAEGLRALLAECSRASAPREWESGEYASEISRLRERWLEETAALRDSDAVPPTVPRFYRELREALNRNAIVVTSSGHAQACVLEFPFYEPRTSVTTGGFSTMGFSYPAAMGAKLAAPGRQVVAVIGDGDFMMTMQEMATAKQYGIGVVAVILNNAGWYSIRDLQIDALGEDRVYATEFATPDGEAYTPDFAAAAKAFGLRAERVDRPEAIRGAVGRALAGEGPALVEVMVQREFPYSGSTVSGWWDVPVPAYLEDRRARYLAERAGEQPAPEGARRRPRSD